tara:strand:- start:22 stop:795 length:774 start_codon:yes stop_codon:yes gene_type:complete
MPAKTGRTYASFYKNDLAVNQTANTGVDTTTRRVQDGAGNDSAISLSDDVFSVQPVNDDTAGAMLVKNNGGNNILAVDTSSSLVKAGASQINCLTMYKEMGLYDFSPTADYHHPLMANNMFFEAAIAADSDWGSGGDPAATLDVSAMTNNEKCVAIYWVLDNDITLDRISYILTSNGTDIVKMHLEAYTLDSGTGDLSSGVTHAHLHNLAINATQALTGEVPIDTANIDAGKVVIGFIVSDDTSDISIHYNIKYHIR